MKISNVVAISAMAVAVLCASACVMTCGCSDSCKPSQNKDKQSSNSCCN